MGFSYTGTENWEGRYHWFQVDQLSVLSVCLGSVLYIYTPVVCHTNLICLVSNLAAESDAVLVGETLSSDGYCKTCFDRWLHGHLANGRDLGTSHLEGPHLGIHAIPFVVGGFIAHLEAHLLLPCSVERR